MSSSCAKDDAALKDIQIALRTRYNLLMAVIRLNQPIKWLNASTVHEKDQPPVCIHLVIIGECLQEVFSDLLKSYATRSNCFVNSYSTDKLKYKYV